MPNVPLSVFVFVKKLENDYGQSYVSVYVVSPAVCLDFVPFATSRGVTQVTYLAFNCIRIYFMCFQLRAASCRVCMIDFVCRR